MHDAGRGEVRVSIEDAIRFELEIGLRDDDTEAVQLIRLILTLLATGFFGFVADFAGCALCLLLFVFCFGAFLRFEPTGL